MYCDWELAAVRLGDIAYFNKVLEKFSGSFEADETLTLIVRLRQNVIRTAIRQISLAYSRIPIKDIARKLQVCICCLGIGVHFVFIAAD